jgi:hypothetical protein
LSEFSVKIFGEKGDPVPTLNVTGIVFAEYSISPVVPDGIV